MQASPGPPESLAGLATRAGVQLADSACVAEHRLQAEQAGIAQGAQFVEADAGEDFHAAQQSARRRACSSSLARPAGAGANGGSAALDGMQGRGAALDIALAELAFELGEEVLHVGTKRRNTWTISSRAARRYRPAPRPVRPRPLPLPARPAPLLPR